MSRQLTTLATLARVEQRRRAFAPAVSAGLVAFMMLYYWADQPLVTQMAISASVAAAVFLLWSIVRWRTRATPARMAAHLDRRYPELEESTALLQRAPGKLTAIAKLQYARAEQRLASLAQREDLLAPFRRGTPRTWALSLLLAALVGQALAWSTFLNRQTIAAPTDVVSATRVAEIQFDVEPPAYMAMAPYRLTNPSVLVPAGSRLRVTLSLDARADRVVLRSDESEVAMFPAQGGLWQSRWRTATAMQYSIHADAKPMQFADRRRSQLIDITPDEPPTVQWLTPEDRLVVLDNRTPTSLPVSLVATDDFAVARLAMQVIRSAGEGEQVSFEQREIDWSDALVDSESSVQIEKVIDLAALGAKPGEELYLSVVATDNRDTGGQRGESSTMIVRWRHDQRVADMTLDNAVIQVMPEYFRSQRQVIIDSEALFAAQPDLSVQEYNARAQRLANDQKALRLRYGRFLGEEQSGDPVAGPADASGHYVGDGHDHAQDEFAALTVEDRFGDAASAIGANAHTHDQEEQATLFDPETRGLLTTALRAMWASEGQLRQYRPGAALPHQYRALAFLKRVQNRSRVFVRRVGVSITPPDASRRLTGELDEVESVRWRSPDNSELAVAPLAKAIETLRVMTPKHAPEATDRVDDWLAVLIAEPTAGRVRRRDIRRMQATMREWRSNPDCGDCRLRLLSLWEAWAPAQKALPSRSVTRPTLFESSP
ncbi:MAG: hypothetical protein AAF290_02070 [Pseudomonadota bacterium]